MKKVSFKKILAVLTVIALLGLTACTGENTEQGNPETETRTDSGSNDTGSAGNTDTGAKSDDKTTATPKPAETEKTPDGDDAGNTAAPVETALKVVTETADGWSEKDGIYTITKGGIYEFSGTLEEGQIFVKAPEEEVEVVLNGVTISSTKDSCIYVEEAEEVTVKAEGGTVNTLNDNRPRKNSEADKTGSACIYSKDDLKIQGKGTLNVNATYNNGIHSKNDIKIKNLTLNVVSPDDAIRGNDSITVESGVITVKSLEKDGLKTKNTDISSKGKQRGLIELQGGTVNIYAADDCIKAAYDCIIGPECVCNQFVLDD